MTPAYDAPPLAHEDSIDPDCLIAHQNLRNEAQCPKRQIVVNRTRQTLERLNRIALLKLELDQQKKLHDDALDKAALIIDIADAAKLGMNRLRKEIAELAGGA
ncbi:hypothetical protein [Henriciella pelagia]|uniref:hypothetical protein n=1 Tax=Henriciella pelagia TaxID=1977912 RepID=UPI003511DA29